jgi:hypothetical protein
MAKDAEAWRILDHGGLETLSDRLWRVEGAVPRMSLRRTMTVAKRRDGTLVIHSAIALEEPLMRQLEAWGAPRALVVPNSFHRLDAPAYKKRYPELKVFTPRGCRAKVEPVIAVDGAYEDFPPDDCVRLVTLPGTGEREGAMLVTSGDGLSVVLNDVVMNMDRKRDVLGFLFTTLLGSAPGPRVSRLSRLSLVTDRQRLRDELERLAALPELARLVVSHEKVTSGRQAASEALRTAASYL